MKKVIALLLPSLLLTGCAPKYEIVNYYDYYVKKCEDFISNIDRDKNCDVAFLGDSITDWYDIVENYYKEYKTANRGIAGDTTNGLLDRLDFCAYALKPKIVYMMIGINNIDTMFDKYEDLLKGIKTNLPDSKVILASLTPVSWEGGNQKVITANKKIKEYANSYSFTYVDLYSHMVIPDNYELIDDTCFGDGLHPNPKGYEIMTSLIKPIIADFLE